MTKIDEAILELGQIMPPLSVRGIALRVRTTGAHVEEVLTAARMMAERPVLDEEKAPPGVMPSKDAAVLLACADLVARGYRVYAPLNDGPAAGRKIDLLAMDVQQANVLRIAVAVGSVDEAGQLHRTNPRRDDGVIVAVVMRDGVSYEPALAAAAVR